MEQSYLNWLLQMNPSTLQITAISAQPVVASDSYTLEGYFKGVLIVGSFHAVEGTDGHQVWCCTAAASAADHTWNHDVNREPHSLLERYVCLTERT